MSYEDFSEGRIGKDILRMTASLKYLDKTGKRATLFQKEFHSASTSREEVEEAITKLQFMYYEWLANSSEYKELGVKHLELVHNSKIYLTVMTYEHQYISTEIRFSQLPSWKFFIKNLFNQMMEI